MRAARRERREEWRCGEEWCRCPPARREVAAQRALVRHKWGSEGGRCDNATWVRKKSGRRDEGGRAATNCKGAAQGGGSVRVRKRERWEEEMNGVEYSAQRVRKEWWEGRDEVKRDYTFFFYSCNLRSVVVIVLDLVYNDGSLGTVAENQ